MHRHSHIQSIYIYILYYCIFKGYCILLYISNWTGVDGSGAQWRLGMEW